MIITKLTGGLGNQMFQYALGRALSIKNNTNLLLDISELGQNDELIGDFIKRGFRLELFNINAEIASKNELEKFKLGINNTIKLHLAVLGVKDLNIYYKQITRLYDKRLHSLKANIYLDGVWPTYKNFKSIRNTLLKEFTLKEAPNNINSRMLEQIKNSNSVALHIRRTDYIFKKSASQHFIHLDNGYYSKAIEIIKEMVKNPIFYIFSDDIDWVKNEMQFSTTDIIYCDINDHDHGYEDMRLLQNCKYFIIANSTFSWWGAWLSEYKDKIVIAPKQWFQNEVKNPIDINLNEWIVL
ncbi:O-antigen biosynthesis glycosyltransferase WbnK [Patescibacteria group bacterium]|nr:O-antigen biosynthesis glycosyltransferase WbnK [Patescibacteria group bacterium]